MKSKQPRPGIELGRRPSFLSTVTITLFLPSFHLYEEKKMGLLNSLALLAGNSLSSSSSSSPSSSCCDASTDIPDPLAVLQGYIPYPHIAAVCMFELVVLLWLGHIRGSIEVHHLWARPCFSSSILHIWFV